MSPTKPEPKQYSLTAHEANMLRFVNNHQNAIFSGLLSTIAGSRLGYTVTERTQYQLSGDFNTMTLMELDIPEEAKAPEGGSPVVTAPETAQEAPSEPTPNSTEKNTTADVPQDTSGSEVVGTAEPTVPSEPQPVDSATADVQATQLAPAEAQPAQNNEPKAS